MRSFLVTAALCCFLGSALLPQQPVIKHSDKSTQGKVAQTAKQNAASTAAAPASAPNTPQTNPEKNEGGNPPNDRVYKVDVVSQPRDWLFAVYVALTGVAVVVGAITAIAVWRQMKANEATADAARLNAQAVIDAERAWMIGIVSVDGGGYGVGGGVRCEVKNLGKTPARVTEKAESFSLQVNASDLPDTPTYESSVDKWENGVLVPPEASLYQTIPALNRATWGEVQKGEQNLFVFGFVKYLDIFDRRHETRYVFKFEPALRGFSPTDHPEYNKAT